MSGFVEVERNVRMSQYKTTTNSIKNLKQACQFAAQALADDSKTKQVELLLAPVGGASSNFGNNPIASKPQLVTELTLFN